MKPPKRLHFLEADTITIKKKKIWRSEIRSKDTFIRAHVPNDRRCTSDTRFLSLGVLHFLKDHAYENHPQSTAELSGHHPEDLCHQEGRVCQGDWQLRSLASSVSEVPRQSFGTCAPINVSFELTSNLQVFLYLFLIVIILASRKGNLFFKFLVWVINCYHVNGFHLFWDTLYTLRIVCTL